MPKKLNKKNYWREKRQEVDHTVILNVLVPFLILCSFQCLKIRQNTRQKFSNAVATLAQRLFVYLELTDWTWFANLNRIRSTTVSKSGRTNKWNPLLRSNCLIPLSLDEQQTKFSQRWSRNSLKMMSILSFDKYCEFAIRHQSFVDVRPAGKQRGYKLAKSPIFNWRALITNVGCGIPVFFHGPSHKPAWNIVQVICVLLSKNLRQNFITACFTHFQCEICVTLCAFPNVWYSKVWPRTWLLEHLQPSSWILLIFCTEKRRMLTCRWKMLSMLSRQKFRQKKQKTFFGKWKSNTGDNNRWWQSFLLFWFVFSSVFSACSLFCQTTSFHNTWKS